MIFFFVYSTAKTLTRVFIIWFLRWNPVPQHQFTAGGEELQWPSLHCVPLADQRVGAMHRGLLHPSHQYICGPNASWRSILFSGDANPQSDLCEGQCGPGSSKKVRLHISAYTWISAVTKGCAWMPFHQWCIHCKAAPLLFNWCPMINMLTMRSLWGLTCGSDSRTLTTSICNTSSYLNNWIGGLPVTYIYHYVIQLAGFSQENYLIKFRKTLCIVLKWFCKFTYEHTNIT